MQMLTAADHGRTVACKCRTTDNWVIGQVSVLDGNIRVLVGQVVRPLRAFIEILKVAASGMLALLRGEQMKAVLCVGGRCCRFITCGGRVFTVRDYYSFNAEPA